MDSVDILEEYLLTRSDLEEIISFVNFKKLFPSTTSESLISKLFEELVHQKDLTIQSVGDDIKKSFDIPLEGAANEFDVPLNRFSLNNVVDSLEKVQYISKSRISLLDNRISSVYEETKKFIYQIDEISLQQITTKVIDETDENVDKCISLIVR